MNPYEIERLAKQHTGDIRIARASGADSGRSFPGLPTVNTSNTLPPAN